MYVRSSESAASQQRPASADGMDSRGGMRVCSAERPGYLATLGDSVATSGCSWHMDSRCGRVHAQGPSS